MKKVCPKCGQQKEATPEFFGFDKRQKDFLKKWCKECTNKYHREKSRQWAESHPGYMKKYYNEHKNLYKNLTPEQKKLRNLKHADWCKRVNFYTKWYTENKEKHKQSVKKYKEKLGKEEIARRQAEDWRNFASKKRIKDCVNRLEKLGTSDEFFALIKELRSIIRNLKINDQKN